MTSDHLTNDQWTAIAPAVAKHFLGEPTKETDREIRWGRKYSKCLLKASGCLTDFENDPNRSLTVLELIERELPTNRAGAIRWLREQGHLPESSPRRIVRRSNRRSRRPTQQRRARPHRTKTAQNPKPGNEKSDTQNFALKLWTQSKPIGDNAEHPFRVWARVRNLLHPYCAVPDGIRWTGYRGGAIVAGVFPLHAWHHGIEQSKPVAIQLITIDGQGEKRYVLGKHKDLDKCSYGPVSAGVFLLGDPTSERVNIVEGVADALAVYSREPGAVLATLGTNAKLANMPDVINWLYTRETWLYPDNDENKASEKGTAALIDCIKVKSPEAKLFRVNSKAVDDDPGEWAKRTPFAEIERYDFEEKKGILFDSGMAWGEADRMAVQHFNGER